MQGGFGLENSGILVTDRCTMQQRWSNEDAKEKKKKMVFVDVRRSVELLFLKVAFTGSGNS